MRISDWSSDVCSSDLDKGADVYFVLQHASHDVGCPNLAHRMLALLVVEPTRDLGHFLSADRVVAKDPLHHFDLGRRSQGVDYFISAERSEEHTSELPSLMRTSYAVFCLKKKKNTKHNMSLNHSTTTEKFI